MPFLHNLNKNLSMASISAYLERLECKASNSEKELKEQLENL
ncbi:hypothetical protein Hdeb2414_s0005g00158791 [Helianthus debilis subsp. tardiflorus]